MVDIFAGEFASLRENLFFKLILAICELLLLVNFPQKGHINGSASSHLFSSKSRGN